MTTQFKNFKLSFIWVETIPAIAALGLDSAAPYAFLGKPGRFAEKFDTLQAGRPSEDLQLPWPRPIGHHFWMHYFAGRHAGAISGLDAWNSHVPLRCKRSPKIAQNAKEPKATFEVFYSSQGVGLVANFYYRGKNKSIREIVKLARGVQSRLRFRTSAGQGGMLLQNMAAHLLEDARQTAFGNAEATPGFNQPFTIATFVQGETDERKVGEGGPVHYALEALTAWNHNLENDDLKVSTIESARLNIHKRAESDLVYARDKGRAVWLPREFAPKKENLPLDESDANAASHLPAGPGMEEAAGLAIELETDATLDPAEPGPEAKRPPRLSCYHRNLTLASLQTMSLGEFVGATGRQLLRGEKVPELLLARAKSAARILNALTLGDPTLTYRSKSVVAQINAANWRPAIDIVVRS
jgi:hypothetical protein